MPALASVTLFAFAFTYVTRSWSVAGAKSLRATIVIGTSVTSPTVSKSSRGL